jgi:hypothetical protein
VPAGTKEKRIIEIMEPPVLYERKRFFSMREKNQIKRSMSTFVGHISLTQAKSSAA